MSIYKKYKIYCLTDDRYEYVIRDDGTIPTACPVDTNHTVSTIAEIQEIEPLTEVKVREETYETGGHFATKTIKIDALKNSVSEMVISFPFPISALAVEFITHESHQGDCVSMSVGKDTIVGAITSFLNPAPAWVNQNYVVGDMVSFIHTDPHFGERVYTCIKDTVSNEAPPDKEYWQHGFEIPVTQTVVDNIDVGYCANLFDLGNTDDLGYVIHVDKDNPRIYVQNNLINSYSPLTPTYVRMTVYQIKDYHMWFPWAHEIGSNKIGGSYVPANTKITIEYRNESVDTDKVFVGRVEYLY